MGSAIPAPGNLSRHASHQEQQTNTGQRPAQATSPSTDLGLPSACHRRYLPAPPAAAAGTSYAETWRVTGTPLIQLSYHLAAWMYPLAFSWYPGQELLMKTNPAGEKSKLPSQRRTGSSGCKTA